MAATIIEFESLNIESIGKELDKIYDYFYSYAENNEVELSITTSHFSVLSGLISIEFQYFNLSKLEVTTLISDILSDLGYTNLTLDSEEISPVKLNGVVLIYKGETISQGGRSSYSYIHNNWLIDIWKEFINGYCICEGEIEFGNDWYEFRVPYNGTISYSRILKSNYNGLGRSYIEGSGPVPKYVTDSIRLISEKFIASE